jgi:hypothetical protein
MRPPTGHGSGWAFQERIGTCLALMPQRVGNWIGASTLIAAWVGRCRLERAICRYAVGYIAMIGRLLLQLREQKSQPVLEQFKAWVDELLPGTPPNSALGKAIAYTTRQWPKLTRHLQHTEIPVDNNYIERQIKHYATGRKSWLFAYDAVGAQASANLFSLVMTARANDVEPCSYLHYLFEHLPAAATVGQIEALLPWNVTPAQLAERQKKQDQLQ